ncbi:uncharacterized protein [Anoplolepis gracilipes]|uniref:uncharacterized protein n=1 Tax=Anoplolepis gracilipes TaxID=354296 RepID=UPI003B9EB951
MTLCKIWNKEMAYEFSLYRRIMWLLGAWPLDSDRNFAKFRALFFIITQTIMVIYICITNMHKKDVMLSVIVDQLVLVACGTLTIIKITLIRLHRDDLLKNLCNAANNWTCIASQKHRQIMLRNTNLGRLVFFFQMGSSYVVIVPLIVGPLLSFATSSSLQNVTRSEEQVQLPYETTCPSNVPLVCYGMYILQSVQLIGTATGNVGSDVFFFGICMHLCGQLEILSLELLRFHNGKENRYWNRKKMIALIERHCLLLNLAKDIVYALDVILVAQLILHALLICLIGLQIIVSLAIHDFFLVGRGIMSFNILMIQLFLYSYMGEALSSKTQAISQAVYLNDWYDLPTKIVRDLYFIIARANVPVRIKAGKFYNIDFNSFKNVLKASASYFSVLQIMCVRYSHLSTMASERWNNDIAYAMNFYKLLAWPIGVWPLQVYNYFSLFRSILSICCMIIMMIIPSIEVYMGCTNAKQKVDYLMLICCGTIGTLKIIWFRLYANNLTNNYNSALHDYLTIENKKERAIMRKHAFVGRIIFRPLMYFGYASCVMFALPLIFKDKKNQNVTNEDIIEYPIPSRCTLEYFHTPTSMYSFLIIFEIVAMLITTTANTGNDALFLNITLHVCGQVKILRTQFINFDVKHPQVSDRFNALIQRHIYLIRMARQLADMISFVLLVELFLFSILLCIMGYQFMSALTVRDTAMMTHSLIMHNAYLTQVTMYCCIGNYLKTQMEDIAYSIYQSFWYEFSTKMIKNLIFIFMQTDSPVALQAGNFITVNLSTLVSLLKTSFSYLSVLRIALEA